MTEKALQQILNKMEEMREEQQSFKISQEGMREELRSFKISQDEMKQEQHSFKTSLENLREEQQLFKMSQDEMKDEQQSFKNSLEKIKDDIDHRFDTFETTVCHMQKDINEIKESVHRIEENEPRDILEMLDIIYNKIDEKDSDILVLNKRLFRVESVLEKIQNKQ